MDRNGLQQTEMDNKRTETKRNGQARKETDRNNVKTELA